MFHLSKRSINIDFNGHNFEFDDNKIQWNNDSVDIVTYFASFIAEFFKKKYKKLFDNKIRNIDNHCYDVLGKKIQLMCNLIELSFVSKSKTLTSEQPNI